MTSPARWVFAALLLQAFGCGGEPGTRQRADSTMPSLLRDSVALSSSASERVQPVELPAAIDAACDSAAAIAHQALELELKREDGRYVDSFRGDPRLGCRITGGGSFAALGNSAGPVEAVDAAFSRRGWRSDLRYMADGPDGSDVGLRLRDMLCLVIGRWSGGDDQDTTARAPTEEADRYEAIVECARDVASNEDAGVPDSIWGIASVAGLDRAYAISLRLQYPPYLDGDFDGDGVGDAAVLVEHRASGKMGIAIIHRGSRRVSVLGAGGGGGGPDDLSWIDGWDVFRKGTTNHLTIGDRPNAQLMADALWVGRRDSVSAFYEWTGRGYAWEAHSRR